MNKQMFEHQKNQKTPLNTEYQRPHPILIVITKRQI